MSLCRPWFELWVWLQSEIWTITKWEVAFGDKSVSLWVGGSRKLRNFKFCLGRSSHKAVFLFGQTSAATGTSRTISKQCFRLNLRPRSVSRVLIANDVADIEFKRNFYFGKENQNWDRCSLQPHVLAAIHFRFLKFCSKFSADCSWL